MGVKILAILLSFLLAQPVFGGGITFRQTQKRVPIGGGAATGLMGGVLTASIVTVSTTAVVTEEDLWTYSLPANTLNVDGKMLRVTVSGQTAANANVKTMRFYFGAGTNTLNVVTTAPNAVYWTTSFLIIRLGATSQRITRMFSTVGTVDNATGSTAATETLSGAVVMKVTGQNGTASAGDIMLNTVVVESLN
jgi:hypothetical protein